MKMKQHIIILLLLFNFQLIAQGPYAPPTGLTGSTAIHKDSSVFVGWATNAVITRGWQNSSDTTLGKTTAGNDSSAIGKSGVNGVVSLGDGGSAILTFATPIKNKLMVRSGNEATKMSITIAGTLGIVAGENPRLIKEKLNAFLPPSERPTGDEAKEGA